MTFAESATMERLRIGVGYALCLLLFAFSNLTASVSAADHATALSGKRILVLFSYHPEFGTTARLVEGFNSVFEGSGVDLHAEYMDTKRSFDDRSLGLYESLLAYKLSQRPPYHLILTADDNALDFAMKHQATLFGGAPVVFTAMNDVGKAITLDDHQDVTGVVEHASLKETLDLAMRLDPRLEAVVTVVDDTPSGRADQVSLKAAAAAYPMDVRIESLGDLSWDELKSRLAKLPPHHAVLRLAAFRDRKGAVLSASDSIALVVKNSPVPVYELREHNLGSGALGGVVISFYEQARQAALMAQRVLEGTPAGDIPVLLRSPNRVTVDHQVLRRFAFPHRRLPPDTIMLNEPKGFFAQYAWLVITVAVVIFGLAALVVYLIWQNAARQRAEGRLQESEERFRAMVEGSLLGVLIHREGTPLFANQAFADILGYASPDQVLALGSMERIYAPKEYERLRAYARARREGGEAPSEYAHEAVRKDGAIIVLHNHVHMTSWDGTPVTQHVVVDITERKRADQRVHESEERYRTLVENAPEAIVVLDADLGRFVDANQNALKLFKLDREALLASTPGTLSPEFQTDGQSSMEAEQEYVARALEGEAPIYDWTYLDAQGEEIPTKVRLVRLTSSGRRLVRGSVTDVSEQELAQRVLAEKSRHLEATLENTDQGIVMMDEDLRVVAFNQRLLELMDIPSDAFVSGDSYVKLVQLMAERGNLGAGDPDEIVRELTGRNINGEQGRHTIDCVDGRVIEVRSNPTPDGGGVNTYTDVTETHRLSEQLSYQASHDSLTGLFNRRAFEQRLSHILAEVRSDDAVHAMCYLDLDQFKVINDTCGHSAGDELLRQLSQILRDKVRRHDTLARLGGDEFGVLLEHCRLDHAESVANAIRAAVEEFVFSWQNKTFRIGVSIGLVPLTSNSDDVQAMLSAADAACYAAKDQGRNRVHVYQDNDSELASRQGEMQWVVKIQHALEERRFELYSQPIVPITRIESRDGPASGYEGSHYELLLRMRDGNGELVAPGLFLPAAERYNLVNRLDRWVVTTAFEYLADDPRALDELFLCTINLSGQSISDDGVLGFIADQLRRTGVAANKICFEVTETAAITNLVRATRFMQALKEMGCCFALDDFGSGLSSFAYLKALPVDYLKIDGMFVKDILDDPIDDAMVRSINDIGHVMGKRTVAEFVENHAILERLAIIGVDYAQGYGIGRPQPLGSTACASVNWGVRASSA